MSTTVSYKGETLTTVDNATKTLLTEGKYLEDDITLVDVTSGGGLPGQVVFYDTIIPTSNATSTNPLNVQLPTKSNYTIVVYADSKPEADSTLMWALRWVRSNYPSGSNGDPFSAILRPNGTIGTDANSGSYNSSTGILQLGGQYGTFKAGLTYHIYMIAVDY